MQKDEVIKRRPGRPRKNPATAVKSKMTFTKSYSKQDMAIEERIAAAGRGESDHIVYLGELVEIILRGEFGSVLKALTAGRISVELQSNREGKLSPDRILGRCEMADILWHDLEQFVIDKDKFTQPINQPILQEVHTATEPNPTQQYEESFVYGA